MTNLLTKFFIKNSDDINNPIVRKNYGTLAGAVGICCNLLLFTIKILAGLLTGAISIVADAFNNLSDAGSSIVTLIGFRMAGKPADHDHPFGHGIIEYIAGLIVSALILLMGFELLKSSVEKILNPTPLESSNISILILIISVCIKLWMGFFNRKIGKKLNASAMIATSADSFNDCVATTAVLIGFLVFKFANINLDGYMGVAVALFVMWAGYNTAKDTIEPLLGLAPDPEFVLSVKNCVLERKEILGIHDMHVHDYGPGRVYVSMHAEIPSDMDVLKAHDIIDSAEEEVSSKFKCEVSIHMDPIEVNNPLANELKLKLMEILNTIDPTLSFHDFRITNGPMRKNIIFDLLVPFDCYYDDVTLRKMIKEKFSEIDSTYFCVIHIDKGVN